MARLLFVVTAGLVGMLGVAQSVWISRANMSDAFAFGDKKLWSALDPAAAYLCDAILFFEPGPIENDFHPGLPVTFSGASIAKLWYIGHSAIDQTEAYTDYWVRRRILLNGLAAALAVITMLACCHPLFLVLRHFMDPPTAYVACAVFLGSVPVLLWLGRFAPEPWMLCFILWSTHLSLRALEGDWSARVWLAMGAATALAVLSKLVALPLLALNLYGLAAAPRMPAKARAAGVAWFALGALIAGGPLLLKLSVPHLMEHMANWTRLYSHVGATSISTKLMLGHQRPFHIHHALVFTLGILGLAVMYRALPQARKTLVPLVATMLLTALATLSQPFWHYYFAFYWLFISAATGGLAILIRRRVSMSPQSAAIAAGVLVVVTCDVWAYPGIAGTYRRYRDVFHQRARLVQLRPALVPAPWEWPLPDYETTLDPSRLGSLSYGRRLAPALDRQRHEGKSALPF